MQDTVKTEQTVTFFRRAEVAGAEVRHVSNATAEWHGYAVGFEFLLPTTWTGDVWHRRRVDSLAPGQLLSAHPQEVFVAQRVRVAGAMSALSMDPALVDQYLDGHGLRSENLNLNPLTHISARLHNALVDVFRAVQPGPTALEIQTRLCYFIHAAVAELGDAPSPSSNMSAWGARAAERVREVLHYDASASIDLSTLAQQAGMSRFQTLRAFKRRYGLPPHTYQLRVRLGLAQKSLREGQSPARVAAEQGFVDQSHMTRHFKRLLGVTPGQYARAVAGAH